MVYKKQFITIINNQYFFLYIYYIAWFIQNKKKNYLHTLASHDRICGFTTFFKKNYASKLDYRDCAAEFAADELKMNSSCIASAFPIVHLTTKKKSS